MKLCLFSENIKKNTVNFSSPEFAPRVVKVNNSKTTLKIMVYGISYIPYYTLGMKGIIYTCTIRNISYFKSLAIFAYSIMFSYGQEDV